MCTIANKAYIALYVLQLVLVNNMALKFLKFCYKLFFTV
jgi:hypothetical protein